MKINVPVSIGELVDKLTILEIKSVKIDDHKKNQEIYKEKTLLEEELKKITHTELDCGFHIGDLLALKADLYEINRGLWHIEDKIRVCEKNKDFGAEFVRLARDVYYTNDKRFEIKNEINQLTNSEVKEVKSYESYS